MGLIKSTKRREQEPSAKFNNPIKDMRDLYEQFNTYKGLVAKELCFTVNPTFVDDMQRMKRSIMNTVVDRLHEVKGLKAFILTRENTESGLPHVHGIGWFTARKDESLSLLGGKVYFTQRNLAGKIERGYRYQGLGKVTVYNLREQLYKDPKGREWNSHFDYIIKDQDLPYKTKNAMWYTSQLQIEDIVAFTPEYLD